MTNLELVYDTHYIHIGSIASRLCPLCVGSNPCSLAQFFRFRWTHPSGTVSAHARSFFWTRLACTPAGFDYKGVRRWTKHVDIFSHKLLLIPINHNNTHWCLAVVDVEQRTIEYFDSMLGGGLSVSGGAKRVLVGLERYLGEEAKDKGRDHKAGKRWQHKVQPSAMRGLISCIGSLAARLVRSVLHGAGIWFCC
jgi:hypothetical protein